MNTKKFHKVFIYYFNLLLSFYFILNIFFSTELHSSSNWDDGDYLNDISLFDRDVDLNSKFKSNLDRELNTKAHMLFRGENDFYTLGLNNNGEKLVCYPNKWFGPAQGNKNTDDLFPENWIKISV